MAMNRQPAYNGNGEFDHDISPLVPSINTANRSGREILISEA